jgi:nitrogen fixation NifU-like protein
MNEFYTGYILDHYRNPRNFGHLDAPSIVAEDINPLCGDTICVELLLDGETVQDIKFSGKGCAISQAATSMLFESITGKTLTAVAALTQDNVLEYVGIGLNPTRMKCAILGLTVLKSAAIARLAKTN